jgi:eukaryotic-like serine/threonine-protein kinase
MPGFSTEDTFPIRPTGPNGFLFDGPEYRYTLVAPLLDAQEPLAVVQRTPLNRDGPSHLVTLKRVLAPPHGKRRQRALEELQLVTRLRHHAIASVYGLEEHQGELYLVMQHIEGLFLETFLETALLLGRTLSAPTCVTVVSSIAGALDAAWHYSEGQDRQPLRIVHRAVSPRSIRVEWSGRPWLTDFGVASSRLEGRLETSPYTLRADLAYAAPEIMRCEKPDGRADLYSLGLVLLELLSGQYPFDPPDETFSADESPRALRYSTRVRAERLTWASTGGLAERIQRFGPEDVERLARDIPEDLRRIVHKALRANPDERYQTGFALSEDLATWLHARGRRLYRKVGPELRGLARKRPAPERTGAFPAEKGFLLTPDEAAMAKGDTHWRRSP